MALLMWRHGEEALAKVNEGRGADFLINELAFSGLDCKSTFHFNGLESFAEHSPE